MPKFIVNGGKKLSGEIAVNSSKNATVALLMAALINKGETTLNNVPEIEEVSRLLEVMKSIGVKIFKQERKLVIRPPKRFDLKNINSEAAKKTRGIILGIGALAGRVKKFEIPQAGGCRLGSRTVKPHLFALENFGIGIKTDEKSFKVSVAKLKPAEFALYETGDTVTENAILAAGQISGQSVIRMASANYMVRDLGYFLEKLGVKVGWVGSGIVEVRGKKNINKKVSYEISEDPIEAMFFLSLAICCNSNIKIKRCPFDFLELELLKLEKMGLKYKMSKKYKSKNGRTDLVDIEVKPSKLTALEEKIHAMPFPGINQDNLPFFAPIATQAKGRTLIHDWTYENRAIYFSELNKLGAQVNLIDPHRVEIFGPTKLTGAEVVCPPALRPAAIILVAMIAASGKSILHNVYPIARGYENIEARLKRLGADIERVE